jgi:hypothetical protein
MSSITNSSSCVRWFADALSCLPLPVCVHVGVTVGAAPQRHWVPPRPHSHDFCPWSGTSSSMTELVSTSLPHPEKRQISGQVHLYANN